MEKIDLQDLKQKKTALVLSGGVVKAGAWHLGVALALQELGFVFKSNEHKNLQTPPDLFIDTYVGSSAGALISVYLSMGHSPIEVIQSNFFGPREKKIRPLTYREILGLRNPMKKPPKSLNWGPFEGLPFLLKQLLLPFTRISGLFTTANIAEYLQKHILKVKNFEDLLPDLFIVATQLDHSRKVIFSKYNYPNPLHDPTASYYTGIPINHAACASMSVPPFYSPYPIKNPQTKKIDYYIDGEIRETLSTHVAIDNHCEYIISSWTHTPYHYHDEIGSLINFGIPAICVQAIYLLVQKKIITHRTQRLTSMELIKTIFDYMKTERFSEHHIKNIVSILEKKLNFNPKVKLIDIYPGHEDYPLFFSSFFSLNPDVTGQAVRLGYKRTMQVFTGVAQEFGASS
jgi:predicted acylesterase/phospholipase RssA